MILTILNELASDNSGNFKKKLLETHKDNELLKKVFVATYNPYVNYWLKQIPEYKQIGTTDIGLEEALDQLGHISSRLKTGHAARDHLQQILCNVNPNSAEVICRIIDRDLKAGFSTSTINKIWPGLIPTFDVMLSHKDTSGIKFPCYSQIKMDGLRVHVHKDAAGLVTAHTRNGKEVMTHGVLDIGGKYMLAGETWDGELLFQRDGKILPRTTGNGIGNKAVRGTISMEEAGMMIFTAWDIVDFTSTLPYSERFAELTTRFSLMFDDMTSTNFRLIESMIANNLDDADHMLAKAWAEGEEGLILKNMHAPWVPKRTKDLGKIKAEEEADLILIGIEEGKNKYTGMVGALVCETSDGLLRVNVGTGLTDDQRKLTYELGSIITVKYNAIISKEGSHIKSLFLPVFIDVRLDKNIANSLKELK